MSSCDNKRIAQMLYAYEIGLLSEKEQQEIELHLYRCESCFREFSRFRSTVDLLIHDSDVRGDIGRLATAGAATGPARPPERRWKSLVPVILVATAALILLLLKPWKIDIGPTQEATAVESYLAVMYFDNLVDETDSLRLGEIAASLLITDLSESAYLRVVSRQRLYDILRLLGRESHEMVSRETAQEIADSVGADVLLLGNILQIEPNLIITTRLIDAHTGHVLSAQKISGLPGDDVFSVVDQLSTQIKDDLSLPVEAMQEPDPEIAAITTHSAAAYIAYLRGLELLNKHYRQAASREFREVLAYDSTFAMAYYYLAELEDQQLIAKAIQYLARASTRDQYLLRSRHASYTQNAAEGFAELERGIARFPDDKDMLYSAALYFYVLRQWDRAKEYSNRVLQVDPLYKMAYNHLAYCHDYLGEYESAIDAINAYIRLAPDEANPYDTRGEIYARHGRVDLAIASYRKALSLKSDFRSSRWGLGHIFLLQRDYAAAEIQYRSLATDEVYSTRVMGRSFLPQIPLYQGKFSEALDALVQGIALDQSENPDTVRHLDTGYKYFLMAMIYFELGEDDRAIQAFNTHLDIYREAYPSVVHYDRHQYIQLLAEAGRLEAANQEARELYDDLSRADYPMEHYEYAAGSIKLAEGNYPAAIDHLSIAARSFNDFPSRVLLARAYLAAGRLSEAVTEFEALLNRYSSLRAFWGIESVKLHYYLGVAYEQSRWFEKAAEQYTIFIEIWEHADYKVPELADAALRLSRLHPQSDSSPLP
ncbi:FlgO family outer membrane protein [Candidatus Zixiibacteriota bacterium]